MGGVASVGVCFHVAVFGVVYSFVASVFDVMCVVVVVHCWWCELCKCCAVLW